MEGGHKLWKAGGDAKDRLEIWRETGLGENAMSTDEPEQTFFLVGGTLVHAPYSHFAFDTMLWQSRSLTGVLTPTLK